MTSPPASLEQQAEFIAYILRRCTCRSGEPARETWALLTRDDVEQLKQIEGRLRRMAPHEAKIRNVVTGR